MKCKNCKKEINRLQKDGDYCDLCSDYRVKGKTDFEVETEKIEKGKLLL